MEMCAGVEFRWGCLLSLVISSDTSFDDEIFQTKVKFIQNGYSDFTRKFKN